MKYIYAALTAIVVLVIMNVFNIFPEAARQPIFIVILVFSEAFAGKLGNGVGS